MALRIVLLVLCIAVAMPGAPACAQSCTPGMRFEADVTIPDDTVLAPGERFEKVWRLRNGGDCAWDATWDLAFLGGRRMDAPRRRPLPGDTAPGATLDVSVWMTAPDKPGSYTGYWQLQDPGGRVVGDRLYVRVLVRAEQPTPGAGDNSVDVGAYLAELDAFEADMIAVLGDLVALVDKPKADDKDWAVAVARASVRLSGLDRRLGAMRPPAALRDMHAALSACVSSAYRAIQELVRWIADARDAHLDEAVRLLTAANEQAARAKSLLDAAPLPTPNPEATPDRRTAWATFHSRNGFLTLRYPPGWRLDSETADVVRFVSPDRALIVAVALESLQADPRNSADLYRFAQDIAGGDEASIRETGSWPEPALNAGYVDLSTRIDDRETVATAVLVEASCRVCDRGRVVGALAGDLVTGSPLTDAERRLVGDMLSTVRLP